MESAIGGAFNFLDTCSATTTEKKTLALRRGQCQRVGTYFLFCQLTLSNRRCVVERQFSAAPLFQPSGTQNDLSSQVPAVWQQALQQHLLQLNTASDGVERNLWAVYSCWVIDTLKYGFLLQCLPTARMWTADKDALGMSPTRAHHISAVC